MFDRWLSPQEVEQPQGLLEYQVLADSGLLDDEEVVARLGREVVRNYVSPGELSLVFDDLGAPQVAEYLRVNKFPVSTMTRHGVFGEIVTGALYRQVRRWCVPIMKPRYKQTPAQAVQGRDVLAFRFRQDPPAIAVPEVKTRASRDRRVGQEAYESLEKVLGRLDESIAFTMARCHDRGRTFLARRLGALLRPAAPRVVERHMLFVHDARSWKEDIVDRLDQRVSKRTELTIVKIADLKDFVARVYDAAGTAPSSTPIPGQENGTGGDAVRNDDTTMQRLGAEALPATGDASARLRAQLRSQVLAAQIGAEGAPAGYTYDPLALRRGLTLARLGQERW